MGLGRMSKNLSISIKLGFIVIATTLLVSCNSERKLSKDELFNHLKPYIGVLSANTLKEVMVDVFYVYKDAIVSQQPKTAHEMMFDVEPTFTNEKLRLTVGGLIGELQYNATRHSTGRVTTHTYYYITYNFFTGDVHSTKGYKPMSRLSYDKFLLNRVDQLDYLTTLTDYIRNRNQQKQ